MSYTPKGQTRERVYRFVRERLLVGEPPTVREVQRALGFSAVESARKHLEALVAEGKLEKNAGRARGFRLPTVDGNGHVTRVPLVGAIQAGNLEEAVEAPDGWLPVDDRANSEGLFALRVRGDSMRDAGILPGDIVIVRRDENVRPGDVVAALVGDEATIKTFRRVQGRPVLEPANPDFAPIRPAPDSGFKILGKVIEVRRRLTSGDKGA